MVADPPKGVIAVTENYSRQFADGQPSVAARLSFAKMINLVLDPHTFSIYGFLM